LHGRMLLHAVDCHTPTPNRPTIEEEIHEIQDIWFVNEGCRCAGLCGL